MVVLVITVVGVGGLVGEPGVVTVEEGVVSVPGGSVEVRDGVEAEVQGS